MDELNSLQAALIERSNDGIAIIQETRLIYVNSRLASLLGYPVEALLGSHFWSYLHPDEKERVVDYYNRRLAGQDVPPVYESAITHKDGHKIEVEVNAGIIEYLGHPADFVFVRDISERKRVDEELRSREEKFRSLVENLSDIVFIIDENSMITFETPSASKVFGYPPGYLIGKRGIDFIHPDDLPGVLPDLQEVLLSDGSPVPSEFRVRSAAGEWIPIEAVGRNQLETPGVEGVVLTARTISARKQAEEKLTRLMEHNQRIVQNVTEGIILQDIQGYMTFANPAAALMLGYEPDELEGMHWTDIIPKDQHNIVKAAHKRRERGESDRYELEMICQDGRRITAWVSGISLMENDRFIGAMAVFSDITVRKLTELRMQRLLEQQIAVNRLALSLGNLTELEQIFKTTGEMVNSLMDADAFFVSLYDVKEKRIRSGYARVYGEYFRPQDMLDLELSENGHTIQNLVLESSKAVCINDYRQAIKDNPVPAAQKDRLSPGHRHMLQLVDIYTRSVLAAPMIVGGETIGIVMVHSRQKDAYREEDIEMLSALANMSAIAIQNATLLDQARQSAEQVNQIMQTVPDGMLLLDGEHHVAMANLAAKNYLHDLAEYSDDGRLKHMGDKSLDVLLTQQPGDMWHEVTHGQQVYEVDSRPILGKPVQMGWVLVIRDVTQEREINRHIQEQDRLATVGQLAAGIAHDFNNIMSTIVLYAQMSNQSPWVSSKDRERMATIYQQAMHATELIRQILDFSRRSVLERQPLSLRPLVKEQVRLFERTLAENISIEMQGMTKRCIVNADPTRIQQVMMNLALNARDAMPEGGMLRIGLDLIEVHPDTPAPLPEMSPGAWVKLWMSDDGIGIEEESVAHIFEPFYTTKGRGQGTGLGLAQVYGIVRQHDGFIDVKSRPGEGSTFTIYLPALPEDLSHLPDMDTGPLVRGRKETVLVVEDSPFTRQALVDSLESLNYRTLTATNGREALDILAENDHQIALVLSDVIMPEMSGLALVREIVERGLDVRTVLLTGHFPGKEMEALRERGLVELIEKPPSLEKLSEVLGKMLER
jgi:PAS domain S-box-containing protein